MAAGRGAAGAAATAAWRLAFCLAGTAAARNVTVSGHSAGGSMAMQHLFAFSATVQGAAIAAGSAYGCGAFPDGHVPVGHCYYGGINVSATIQYAYQRFRNGSIDDLANLRNIPILLFNGQSDNEVYPACMLDVEAQLQAFADPQKLATNFRTKAAHVWSVDHGLCWCGACSVLGFGVCCDINNCRYDLTGDMLTHFYGPLRARTRARPTFHWINQTAYLPPPAPTWTNARMDRWALAYLPSGCRANPGACRVHVNYHGCISNNWQQRQMWVQHLDINEYGEANDIIALYPQAKGDAATGAGCWNWGFPQDDLLFDTNKSAQLLTVMAILQDLPGALARALELPRGKVPPGLQEDAEPVDSARGASEGALRAFV